MTTLLPPFVVVVVVGPVLHLHAFAGDDDAVWCDGPSGATTTTMGTSDIRLPDDTARNMPFRSYYRGQHPIFAECAL